MDLLFCKRIGAVSSSLFWELLVFPNLRTLKFTATRVLSLWTFVLEGEGAVHTHVYYYAATRHTAGFFLF